MKEDTSIPTVDFPTTYPSEQPQETNTETQIIILSIVILTRNRRKEIIRAISSCIECSILPKTEFIIIDNASQDGTGEVIDQYFQRNPYEYHYFYSPENLGVAGGRNQGIQFAHGRYVYFLDDDAYIDGPKELFFEKMIKFLEANENCFCVSTSIFDTSSNGKRYVIRSKRGLETPSNRILMFLGGSCMVDKHRLFNPNKLFLEQQIWGMEELFPSIKSYASGKYVVEMQDINIIHDPSRNSRLDQKTYILLVCVGAAYVRFVLYPTIAYPLIYLFFFLRIVKHLGYKSLHEAFSKLYQTNKKLARETIPLSALLKLTWEFGITSVF